MSIHTGWADLLAGFVTVRAWIDDGKLRHTSLRESERESVETGFETGAKRVAALIRHIPAPRNGRPMSRERGTYSSAKTAIDATTDDCNYRCTLTP